MSHKARDAKTIGLAIGPKEKLEIFGAAALSEDELLAVLLRTGMHGVPVASLAKKLLSEHGGVHGLENATVAELSSTSGVGKAKATLLKAAFELARRNGNAAPTPDTLKKANGRNRSGGKLIPFGWYGGKYSHLMYCL